VGAQQAEPRVKQGAQPRQRDDVAAVQGQEDGADGQQLLLVVPPGGIHALQEGHRLQGGVARQGRHDAPQVGVQGGGEAGIQLGLELVAAQVIHGLGAGWEGGREESGGSMHHGSLWRLLHSKHTHQHQAAGCWGGRRQCIVHCTQGLAALGANLLMLLGCGGLLPAPHPVQLF
jgi:hypothetical protein